MNESLSLTITVPAPANRSDQAPTLLEAMQRYILVNQAQVWSVHARLVFKYSISVEVHGVNTLIELVGTATLQSHRDGDGRQRWWIYGVHPGAIAATGLDFDSAKEDLRRNLTGMFRDLAGEYTSIETYREAASEFLSATDPDSEREWASIAPEASRRAIFELSIRIAQHPGEPGPSVLVRESEARFVPTIMFFFV